MTRKVKKTNFNFSQSKINLKIIIFIFILFIVVFVPNKEPILSPVSGYQDSTHREIINKAIDLLFHDGYTEIADEMNNVAYKGKMKAGSSNADEDLANLYHYHQPSSHLGWYIIYESAADYGQEYYELALDLYQNGDLEDAYYHLGHALHVVADLTVPCHTDIISAGIPRHTEYETWVNENWDSWFSETKLYSSPRLYSLSQLEGHYGDEDVSEGVAWDYVDFTAHQSESYYDNVVLHAQYGQTMDVLGPIAFSATAGLLYNFFLETRRFMTWYQLDDDPNFDKTTDSTGNYLDMTINGEPTNQEGVIGGAYSFDGLDDYLELPDMNWMNFQTITLTGWFKANTFSDRFPLIDHYNYGLSVNNEGKPYAYFRATDDTYSQVISPYSVNLGQWYFLAATFDLIQTEKKITLYIDGKTTDIEICYKSINLKMGRSLEIGHTDHGSPTGIYANGLIDDIQIYSKVLSSNQIFGLFKSAIIHLPLDEYQEPNAYDFSGHDFHMNIDDSPIQYLDGTIGEAYYFDGMDDSLNLADNAWMDMTSFTLMGWIKADNYDNRFPLIDHYNFGLQVDDNGKAKVYYFGPSGNRYYICADPVPTGEWHHLAATFSLDTPPYSLKLYMDGEEIGSLTPAETIDFDHDYGYGDALYIAYSNHDSGKYSEGFIDDVHIYQRTLSRAEIFDICYSTALDYAIENDPNAGSDGWSFEEGSREFLTGNVNSPSNVKVENGYLQFSTDGSNDGVYSKEVAIDFIYYTHCLIRIKTDQACTLNWWWDTEFMDYKNHFTTTLTDDTWQMFIVDCSNFRTDQDGNRLWVLVPNDKGYTIKIDFVKQLCINPDNWGKIAKDYAVTDRLWGADGWSFEEETQEFLTGWINTPTNVVAENSYLRFTTDSEHEGLSSSDYQIDFIDYSYCVIRAKTEVDTTCTLCWWWDTGFLEYNNQFSTELTDEWQIFVVDCSEFIRGPNGNRLWNYVLDGSGYTVYIDYIKQLSAFDYGILNGAWGADGWSFDEQEREFLTGNVNFPSDVTVESGYLRFSTENHIHGLYSTEHQIDFSFYSHCVIRAKASSPCNLDWWWGYEFFDEVLSYKNHFTTALTDQWQIFIIDCSGFTTDTDGNCLWTHAPDDSSYTFYIDYIQQVNPKEYALISNSWGPEGWSFEERRQEFLTGWVNTPTNIFARDSYLSFSTDGNYEGLKSSEYHIDFSYYSKCIIRAKANTACTLCWWWDREFLLYKNHFKTYLTSEWQIFVIDCSNFSTDSDGNLLWNYILEGSGYTVYIDYIRLIHIDTNIP